MPAGARCSCGIVTVEKSSCCSTETGDESAHLQATAEELSVPHLMSRRRERTFDIHHQGALLWRFCEDRRRT